MHSVVSATPQGCKMAHPNWPAHSGRNSQRCYNDRYEYRSDFLASEPDSWENGRAESPATRFQHNVKVERAPIAFRKMWILQSSIDPGLPASPPRQLGRHLEVDEEWLPNHCRGC